MNIFYQRMLGVIALHLTVVNSLAFSQCCGGNNNQPATVVPPVNVYPNANLSQRPATIVKVPKNTPPPPPAPTATPTNPRPLPAIVTTLPNPIATNKLVSSVRPVVQTFAAFTNSATKELLGTWCVVGRNNSDELITIELRLDDHGWATLKIPRSADESVSSQHRVAYENQILTLIGSDGDLLIGKVVEVNRRQMVIERHDGIVTFVRR